MSHEATLVRAILPSGNHAVYDVSPQHLNHRPGTTLNSRAIQYGAMRYVRMWGEWHNCRTPIGRMGAGPVNGTLITDPKVIQTLESIPLADTGTTSESLR